MYVHHGKGIGGAPISLLYLIRNLDRERFDPVVVCIHESAAADLFRDAGIETVVETGIRDFSHTNVLWYPWWQAPKIVWRALHVPFSIRRARTLFRGLAPDIVHLNTSTLLAAGIAARRSGAAVVWHIREPLSRGVIGIRRALVRAVIDRCADLIVPICRYDGEQLRSSDRIRVVYNFVEFERFHPGVSGIRIRSELGIPVNAPVALMLGGVSRIKGTLEFVRAAAEVLQTHPDAHFILAGEDVTASLRSRLNGTFRYARRVHTAAAGVASRLHLVGVRSDIPELLAAASVLCFPSTTPHFARPAIEAAAMARPVIASDLGGPQELVVHGETGLLVPAGDVAALAGAMRRIFDDPRVASEMGERGANRARLLFDASTNTRAVMDLYSELLQQVRTSRSRTE